MRKFICFISLFLIFIPDVEAQRGCCSHHGGVAGCSSTGRQICQDGTLSKTCTCTPTVQYIYGCTDKSAKNYNSSADKDDGSCIYYIYGCTDKAAKNYNEEAQIDDNSCEYEIEEEKEITSTTSIPKEEAQTEESNPILALALLILSYFLLFNQKIKNQTLISSKIKINNLCLKIIICLIYAILILPPIIDIFSIVFKKYRV